jgi:uncharacterized phiE125 gp8 family phage protein
VKSASLGGAAVNSPELNAAYVTTTAPSAAVLSTSQLKTQCRVDHDHENALLDELGAEATAKVEEDSRTLLRTCVKRLELDRFPDAGEPIYLEWTPVTSVTSITYIDNDGNQQTWSSADYVVSLGSLPPRIVPAWGKTWPSHREQPGSVKVTFAGGFAATTTAGFPLQARCPIRLLVGIWYDRPDFRGSVPEELEKSYRANINGFSWSAR